MKDGGLKWWLGPDAKRKRGKSVIEPSGLANPSSRPTKKMVFYDMCYKDGGGKWFSAPAMKVAEDGSGNAETDEYTHQEKLLGYIAVIAVIVAVFSLFCIL